MIKILHEDTTMNTFKHVVSEIDFVLEEPYVVPGACHWQVPHNIFEGTELVLTKLIFSYIIYLTGSFLFIFAFFIFI